MSTRKNRLAEVYEYLRGKGIAHTKTELADALGVRRPGIYSAMNGDERYLTDSLFKKICATFQGVFSLHYLLTGEGSLLEPSPPPPEEPPASTIDTSSLVNAALAAKDETIAALHATIATLSAQLQDRAELIATLRDNISALRRELARIAPADYPLPADSADYPFSADYTSLPDCPDGSALPLAAEDGHPTAPSPSTPTDPADTASPATPAAPSPNTPTAQSPGKP